MEISIRLQNFKISLHLDRFFSIFKSRIISIKAYSWQIVLFSVLYTRKYEVYKNEADKDPYIYEKLYFTFLSNKIERTFTKEHKNRKKRL